MVDTSSSKGSIRKEDQWSGAFVVKNTFLEYEEKKADTSDGGSRASSDPTHNRSSNSSSQGDDDDVIPPRSAGPAAGSGDPNTHHKIWGGVEDARSAEGSSFTDERFLGVAMLNNSSDGGSLCQSLSMSQSQAEDAASEARESRPDMDPAWTGFVSKGSEFHAQGNCKPCFFMASKSNCMNGTGCNFCHMPHETAERLRPCKSKRARAKRQAKQLAQSCNDPDQLAEVASALQSSREAYLKSVLQSRARNMADTGNTDDPGKKASASSGEVPKKKNIVSL
mmetsp:Transcript_71859/g.163119  ORF Transcript_71859/g.163119 Transcript_71859/m.163119 type:complete len:280 (-) Transcript_71859:288-1127(-)